MDLEQDCEEVIDENIGSVIRRNTINMKEIVNKLEKTIEYEHTDSKITFTFMKLTT